MSYSHCDVCGESWQTHRTGCTQSPRRSLPASAGSVSDTPRTDAIAGPSSLLVDRDFARQIERDLITAMAALNAVAEFVEEDYIEDCATPEYARAVKMMRAVQDSLNDQADRS